MTDETDPLAKAKELELESKNFGFYWENIDQIIDQVTSECREVVEAYNSGDKEHLEEEVGDLVHAAISLTVYCGFDPKKTLQKSVAKYEKRYRSVVEFAKNDGYETLQGMDFDTLMKYWNKAKT